MQDGGKHGGRNATEREINYRYFGLRKQLARKPKREREKGTSTTWKRTVKAKSYRSMRKTEAPHSLRIVFDSGEVGTEAATQCSCKAGTGKCQHLAALFIHVMAKLRNDDSPSSHLQQWHRTRGPSLEPQRWSESERST